MLYRCVEVASGHVTESANLAGASSNVCSGVPTRRERLRVYCLPLSREEHRDELNVCALLHPIGGRARTSLNRWNFLKLGVSSNSERIVRILGGTTPVPQCWMTCGTSMISPSLVHPRGETRMRVSGEVGTSQSKSCSTLPRSLLCASRYSKRAAEGVTATRSCPSVN